MARKRIRLSQFEIEGETFEEGADLVHHYRRCNWHINAVGLTPMELVWASRDHARECNGERQVPKALPPPADAGLVPQMLARQIREAVVGPPSA